MSNHEKTRTSTEVMLPRTSLGISEIQNRISEQQYYSTEREGLKSALQNEKRLRNLAEEKLAKATNEIDTLKALLEQKEDDIKVELDKKESEYKSKLNAELKKRDIDHETAIEVAVKQRDIDHKALQKKLDDLKSALDTLCKRYCG